MNIIEIKTQVISYASTQEIQPEYQKLIEKAKEITKSAYAPYSNFKVGAAILLENNKIITGNNQENAAFPSGLCAERVAMFYANANYPDTKVNAIAISAKNSEGFLKVPVAPCGGCRQVLLETESRYKNPIKVFLIGEELIYEISKISDLLPLNFNADSLNYKNNND